MTNTNIFRKASLFILTLTLITLQILCFPTFKAHAETTANGFVYTIVDTTAKTAKITGYTGAGGDVVIPSIIDGYTIIRISHESFAGSNLTSVKIPDSVTTIGAYAFQGCTKLASVSIGKNVSNMDPGVFADCKNLTDVIIPNSLTSISNDAFINCENLKSATLPSSLTSIGDNAFSCCKSLENISIPDNVVTVGPSAFYYCNSLSVMNIGKNLTEDFNIPFGCYKLTAVNVSPENIAYCSNDGILYNKSKTTLLYYPASKTGSSFTIPNSVTSIGFGAFYGCSNLTNIVIPDKVTIINDSTFADCKNLKNITLPNGLTRIGDFAFKSCSSLESLTIPDSVVGIGSYALYECKNLSTISIGKNVTYIDNYLLFYCDKLASINVSKENTTYCSVDGILYDKLKTTLIRYPACKTGSLFNIPNSVTNIGYYAFRNCSSLTNVILPSSLKSVDKCAFFDCISLTSVTIPDSVTSISDMAFFNCNNLASITIPNGVTKIGALAFWSCSKLTTLTIPKGVSTIDYGAFFNCSGLKTITAYSAIAPVTNGIGNSGYQELVAICGDRKISTLTYTVPPVFYNVPSTAVLYIPSGAKGYNVIPWSLLQQQLIAATNVPTPPALKLNGWVPSNNTWYYYQNGVKVKNGWAKDSTGWCFLSAVDGSWVIEGWAKDSIGWGYVRNGYWVDHATWAKDSMGWCFIGAKGYWNSSVSYKAANPVDDAAVLVKKAEASKLKADIDAARAAVIATNVDATEQAPLLSRLNAIK